MFSSDFIERLKKQIEFDLPGEAAHSELSPNHLSSSSEALKQSTDHRISSVAIVLQQTSSNQLSLILIQRPHYEGAHSGQISFPGGKKDVTDPNTEFTARRECFEEIGLSLDDQNYIGKLTDVFIPISKFLVHPYLYFYSKTITFNPDDREVSEIITCDLTQLIAPENRSNMEILLPNGLVQRTVPCFLIGEKKVWGATALILNELKELLLRIA
jgi:8-oxo-dGTP pyrophosphatase MutT (NUDIX family)